MLSMGTIEYFLFATNHFYSVLSFLFSQFSIVLNYSFFLLMDAIHYYQYDDFLGM